MNELLEYINQLDTKLTLAINHSFRSEWMDEFMWIVSENWLIFVVLCFGIVFLFKYYSIKKAILQFICVASSIGIIDLIVSRVFKPGFGRLRPTHQPELENMIMTVNDYVGGHYGFVSGHAATNAVGAGLLILFLRKKTYWVYFYFLWIILVSYSRMYLGVHYLGDVSCGAIFGLIMSYFIYQLMNKIKFFGIR